MAIAKLVRPTVTYVLPYSGDGAARFHRRSGCITLTHNFKDLVGQRLNADPAFAEALLREGVDALLAGDLETGKTILRDYIKATVGFERLGEATGAPPKSLIRMFGPRGNPQARNLFGVISYLQQRAGVRLHVSSAA